MSFERALEAQKVLRKYEDLEKRIIRCLYRPFDERFLFWSETLIDRPRAELNRHMLRPNLSFVTTRQTREPFGAMVTNLICGQHKITAVYDGSLFFPLYLYPNDDAARLGHLSEWEEGKEGRRPNLASRFVETLQKGLGLRFVSDDRGDLSRTFGPRDVFDCIYAILHSPRYRKRYAEFLRIDFPRIPPVSDRELFRSFVEIGQQLVNLHLLDAPILSRHSIRFPVAGTDRVESGYPRYVIPKGKGSTALDGRVYVNSTQFFEGVPKDDWEYGVGGYQVCSRWLKDRKGRTLSYEEKATYQKIVTAIGHTRRLMVEIDKVSGRWPVG